MTSEQATRYRELEKVVESLVAFDLTKKKEALAEGIGKLQRRGVRALNFREKPRNTNLGEAREIASARAKERSASFKAAVAPAIAAARQKGARTVREIATALNAAGVTTSRGGTWSPGTLHRFLNGD